MFGFGHHQQAASPQSRRQFYIVTELNGKVLDIKGASPSPGTEICVYRLKHPPPLNQLWYLDNEGCIRSALNDMTFNSPERGKDLKTEPPSDDPRSQWRFDGQKIVNAKGEVLDVRGASKSDGAEICAYEYLSKSNQHWHTQREFLIISEMNGKVLDIKKANPAGGTEVIMYNKKTPAAINQMWYYNTDGFILSALNDMVFTCKTKGKDLLMEVYNPSDPTHQWKLDGVKIVNGVNECLDIRGKSNSEGANLCAYEYKNDKNQHWKIELV